MSKTPLDQLFENLNASPATISHPEYQDVFNTVQLAKALQALPQDDRSRLYGQFNKVITNQKYQDILTSVCDIHSDPFETTALSEQSVLNRISRFINRSGVDHVKDGTGNYDPSLPYKMVVKVCFTGIGTEHNEDHYGIVWESKTNRDHVLMIATTSYKESQKYYDHYFNIGKIGFLGVDTIVMISHVGPISRKRILFTEFEDPSDNLNKIISISPEQENRIRDGFRVVCLSETTLYKYILDSQRRYFPEFVDHDVQYHHLWRPFKIVSNNSVSMKYHLIDTPGVHYEIKWHKSAVGSSNSGRREKLLRSWRDALPDNTVKPRLTRQQSIIKAYNYMLANKKVAAVGTP